MYEVRCGETSRSVWASVFVCDIYEDGARIEQVEFVAYKARANAPRRLEAKRPRDFVVVFEEGFGSTYWINNLVEKNPSATARNLEWLISEIIEQGLWTPGEN